MLKRDEMDNMLLVGLPAGPATTANGEGEPAKEPPPPPPGRRRTKRYKRGL